MIDALLADVDGLLGAVRRGRSVNINDQATKARAIALATRYFKDVRPGIVRTLGASADLTSPDNLWQDVIRLAQGNNSRRSYINKLRAVRQQLGALSVTMLAAARPAAPSPPTPTPEEQLLIATLEGLVPSAGDSYRQGLVDLSDAAHISFRGTATEFREALREVLDHLAPDEAVMKEDAFKLEAGQSKPTMKQKVRFVLKSRGLSKTQRETTEKSDVKAGPGLTGVLPRSSQRSS